MSENVKSPTGLNDGALVTLLIVVENVVLNVGKVKLILFDILVHVLLHTDVESESYEGKVIVSVQGVGVDVGRVNVKFTVMMSLFFKEDGVMITEGNVLVWFIYK